ncbi:MAG: xanthine dehydrogenase family protein molybdopterin-binding subunit, partial [Proteobacteria bacterium]|nr:xanthine dehydrogenase family protein molybdopterin-binding subunit [Pseudomonadota bacterium]
MTFLVGASGLLVACNSKQQAEALRRFEPNVWVTITSDGKITVMVPVAEMGQGSLTSLPLIFAEELDADWQNINPVQVVELKKEFGNPYFGGLIYSSGSRGVIDYFTPLRIAGAQARQLLMMAAAEHWQVPLSELTTKPGLVDHSASGQQLSYGEIATFAKAPEILPEITQAELRGQKDFRLIGHDTPRVDVPSKVNGAAEFAMDVQVPGMVYAAILHAPAEGESPVNINKAEALKVPGVQQVLALDNAVAVIGATVEATHSGKKLLEVEWTGEAAARSWDSDKTLGEYSAAANDLSHSGTPWRIEGEFDTAFDSADRQITSEYLCDYVYHAQMEPLNATAFVNAAGDRAEIWCGTQAQSLTIMAVASVLDTTTDRIKLNQLLLGGGFGRRAELEPTYVIEAVQLSRQIGKPVKVIWSREDDLRNGWFRPATAQLMRAGVNEQGQVVAWSHRMAGPSVLQFYNSRRWSVTNGRDIVSMHGAGIPSYDIANIKAEHVLLERTARLSPWRGVGMGYIKFAVESFVDELAELADEDPVEFRLKRLLKTERSRRVLEAVAKAANWGAQRAVGRALGVAVCEYDVSQAAGIVEISVNKDTGKIKVHNVWVAADIGLAVQPHNVEAQLEGAIIYGLGQALTERVTMKAGQVQQSNFHDYHVMRMADTPDIYVQIIPSDMPPSGVGELSLPITGGAVAN